MEMLRFSVIPPVGELVVVLDGDSDQVLAAQKAIENAGVSLQVLKKGAQ